MKKFNLTIPKPCHENWDHMSAAEKGRFCGSCQKVVVDFTGMNDRGLANFFKKPVGNVCGRFQQDQLNREIVVPKKPIPWLRHFIHIAWPAFILMLKSCGTKDKLTGVVVPHLALTNSTAKEESSEVILGALAMPVPKEDTTHTFTKGEVAPIVVWEEPVELMGDIAVLPIDTVENRDTVSQALPVEEVKPDYLPLDTVTVTGHHTISCSRIAMGTVSYVKGEPLTIDSSESNVADKGETTLLAYPNPVRAGHVLHLKFALSDSAPQSIQLLTTNGQRVVHKTLSASPNTTLATISLPATLTSGIYFIQAVYANGTTIQSRVMVGH
jgi:hypothetical protein